MKIHAICFRDYLAKMPNDINYVMIDPPWHYGMAGSKLQDATTEATNYDYWSKDNESEVAGVLAALPSSVDAVLIWTTNPMLEATLRAIFRSDKFRFRSLLTWEKKTVGGEASQGDGPLLFKFH